MPKLVYRELEPSPVAKPCFERWIEKLDASFQQHTSSESRSEIVARELHRIYKPHIAGGPFVSPGAELLVDLCLDPRNVTLEPEYYSDIDIDRYNQRKPLIYFWQMFDRSSLGLNHWLGFRFRAMLGKHIFRHMGSNVKIFHNVEFSFGYNLVIEDDCVIHRNVLLDDRGGIILHKGASVSDYANIYSHTHDIHDQADVTNKLTVIGPGARITYHATVLAGTHVGEDAMLGTMGVATRNVDPHAVSVGVPARVVRVKDRGQPAGLSAATPASPTLSHAKERRSTPDQRRFQKEPPPAGIRVHRLSA